MVTITSKDFKVTDAIKEHIETQCAKFSKFKIDIINPHVILTKEGKEFVSEIIIHSNLGEMFAKASDPDLYSAIIKTEKKLKSQINKKIEAKKNHKVNNIEHVHPSGFYKKPAVEKVIDKLIKPLTKPFKKKVKDPVTEQTIEPVTDPVINQSLNSAVDPIVASAKPSRLVNEELYQLFLELESLFDAKFTSLSNLYKLHTSYKINLCLDTVHTEQVREQESKLIFHEQVLQVYKNQLDSGQALLSITSEADLIDYKSLLTAYGEELENYALYLQEYENLLKI